MAYNVSVIGDAFDEIHLEKIRSTAHVLGCYVRFFKDHDSAMPYMKDTDIIFGPSDVRATQLIQAVLTI